MLPTRIFLACPFKKPPHKFSSMQHVISSHSNCCFTNVTICLGIPQNYSKIRDLHSVLGGQVNNLNVFVRPRGSQT